MQALSAYLSTQIGLKIPRILPKTNGEARYRVSHKMGVVACNVL